ncbi:MAG: DUF4199 domain-containing protein [Chitinophagales bacterium]|nr:DUF4199 domain-containing protein [Chitinophagaceae bacterium]MCB9064562.1 DUF4199 domain-containing protein [Chitinophagales bacterium]
MRKVVLTFGITAGLIVVVLMFLTMPSVLSGDMEAGEAIGYTTMVLALSSIFFAIKTYRDKYLGGSIKFGKAFVIGLLISLIASFMYSTGWEAYMSINNIDGQEFMESYMDSKVEKMKEVGAAQTEIDAAIEEGKYWMKIMTNPLYRFLFTMFGEMFWVGLIVSLICAAILRNKNVLPAKNVAIE